MESNGTHNPQPVLPHLIVKFRSVNGEEQFEWGVTAGIPMMGLLGAVIRTQVFLNLEYQSTYDNRPYIPGALILEWNDKEREFGFVCDPDIPIDPLIGMLEVIKSVILANITKSAEANKNMQRLIIGIDGRPFRSN